MPISREMFEALGDYSGLDNLHVFGDFFNLYSLKVPNTTITEVERLFDNLKMLEGRIFTMYVAFVLSKAGFSPNDLFDPGVGDGEEKLVYTPDFKVEDWLDYSILFTYDEPGSTSEWWLDFENIHHEVLRVYFVTTFYSDKDPITGEIDECTHMFKMIEEGSKSDSNVEDCTYIVVHPFLHKKVKKTFDKTKEILRKIKNQDILLSTNQFAFQLLKDKKTVDKIEIEWAFVRGKLLQNFQKEFPFLAYAIHQKQMYQSEEQLKKARIKFESGNDYEGAISEAAVACEGLLNILHAVYQKDSVDRMSLDRYLCDLRDEIIEDYGDDILQDLELIRDWRNKVVHAPRTTPDLKTALKIVTKAELFKKIFDENYRLKITQKRQEAEDQV